jgi:hypothetical protein
MTDGVESPRNRTEQNWNFLEPLFLQLPQICTVCSSAASDADNVACIQTVMEACMFLCEAAIFICSILLVKWDMVSDDGVEGYDDMEVYTVLCSVSTFFALSITLALLLVPTHVRIHSASHRAERRGTKPRRTVPTEPRICCTLP